MEALVRVNRNLYSKTSIMAAVYRHVPDYSFSIDEAGEDWVLTIRAKNGGSLPPDSLADRLRSDLVDYQLRSELEDAFRPIREMVVAKAFGKGA